MGHFPHHKQTIFHALMIILLGVLLLLNNLDYIEFGTLIKDYWPVLLILIGLNMILKREKSSADHSLGGDKDVVCDTEQAIYSNIFGDMKIKINSRSFKGGKINNTFGDISLDLEKMNIEHGEQILEVHGVFGDIKVSLAKGLPVFIRANTTAGTIKIFDKKVDGFSKELQYQSEQYDSAEKKIKIFITQVFGDIKVW